VECTHGILSLDHTVQGSLVIDSTVDDKGRSEFESGKPQTLTFDGGRGYLEKDWGKHFPKSWVWIQTNLFPKVDLAHDKMPSLFFSAAQVPYMGTSFPGFICGFLDQHGELHKFCSYNLSRFNAFVVDEDAKTVNVELENWSHVLRISMSYDVPMVELYGPLNGKMALSVPEGLQGKVKVELRCRGGEQRFKGTGHCAGCEVQGDVKKLTASLT